MGCVRSGSVVSRPLKGRLVSYFPFLFFQRARVSGVAIAI